MWIKSSSPSTQREGFKAGEGGTGVENGGAEFAHAVLWEKIKEAVGALR